MHKRERPSKNDRPELSRLELAVMDVVWELGTGSTSQIVAAFQKRRPLAPTTIRTVLANLRRKGYLARVPTVERGFRLKATVSRAVVARRSLREVLTTLFQGSLQQTIACLVSDEKLSDEEMKDIRRILESRAGGKKV
jgi:BlaI family transcriptional regulator, penicillinase repressor